MNIHEYQAKQLLNQYNIPVLDGFVAFNQEELGENISSLNGPKWVVKAQIHAGGRGKGGGVKVVDSIEAVHEVFNNMMGMKLITNQTGTEGKVVNRIYIEDGCNISKEFYLSYLVDRKTNSICIIASSEGGMDIEEVAEKTPEAIHKIWTHPVDGLNEKDALEMADKLGLDGHSKQDLVSMLESLSRMFIEKDCSMIEINPLVKSDSGDMIALDAKVSFDDNASFRHPWMEEMRDYSEEEEVEIRAHDHGLSYVKLDGNIGCLVNGAGLAMASMDVIKLYGGEPANFLDIGGGATKESITTAFGIILEDENVEGILVNIFGGIIQCDMVARSVIEASNELGLQVPLVVRFSGTNHVEGKEVLDNCDLDVHTSSTLAEGAEKIVNLTRGEE